MREITVRLYMLSTDLQRSSSHIHLFFYGLSKIISALYFGMCVVMRCFAVCVGPYMSAFKCTCTYLKLLAFLCNKTILNRTNLTWLLIKY